MKNQLGGKIMTGFVALGLKTYSYLTDDNGKTKKARSIKKRVIKQKLNFEDYKDCLEENQL